MVRNQQVLKLFLVLSISVVYIFSFSNFGASAYHSIMKNDRIFPEGTMIGSVAVGGKTANEALRLVDEELTRWYAATTVTLKYREKEIPFDLSYYTFHLEETLAQVVPGQQNQMDVELEPIQGLLADLSEELTLDSIRKEELENSLLASARMLKSGQNQIRLDEYVLDNVQEDGVLGSVVISSSYVEKEMDALDGQTITVEPKTQFSLLKWSNENGEIPSSSLRKIATAIYELLLSTNFSIIERHISSTLPAYATLGFEANVDGNLKYDFVFSNPNDFSYSFEFAKGHEELIVSLKGPKFINQYVPKTEGEETFQPKTIRQFHSLLDADEVQVKEQGKEGYLIKVYREHFDEKGNRLKSELISEDFYPPINRIEVQGLISKGEQPGTSSLTKDENNSSSPSENGEENPNRNESESEVIPIPDENADDGLWGRDNEIPK